MKSIILPEGTTYVRFDELAELLARALNPDAEQDGDNLDAALRTIQLESDLPRAVQSGDLRVCNPLSHLPLTLSSGNALKLGVVMIHDLREFAARLGLSVEFEETRNLSEQENLEERAELTAKAVLREAPAQKPPAVPVPSLSAPAKPVPVVAESAAQRQARRWQMCIDAGLTMPTDTYAHLPRGVGRIANALKISRQALTQDLDAHRERHFRK